MHLVEFNGKIASISEHCRDMQIDRSVVYARARRTGESYEECLNYYKENGVDTYKLEFNGKYLSLSEHCENLGVNYSTVVTRHRRTGESYEKCLQYYKENGVQYQNKEYKIKSRALYTRWHDMKSRCYNPNNPMYYRYGGIGVKVCDRWHIYENFEIDLLESFLNHVEKYGLINTTLDRFPNKEGNYEPANIRWATRKEQQNNLTTNRIIIDNLTLSQFSEMYNINKATVRQRLKLGWTIEEIIHTPVQQNQQKNT